MRSKKQAHVALMQGQHIRQTNSQPSTTHQNCALSASRLSVSQNRTPDPSNRSKTSRPNASTSSYEVGSRTVGASPATSWAPSAMGTAQTAVRRARPHVCKDLNVGRNCNTSSPVQQLPQAYFGRISVHLNWCYGFAKVNKRAAMCEEKEGRRRMPSCAAYELLRSAATPAATDAH